jgi:hypothetical protein
MFAMYQILRFLLCLINVQDYTCIWSNTSALYALPGVKRKWATFDELYNASKELLLEYAKDLYKQQQE